MATSDLDDEERYMRVRIEEVAQSIGEKTARLARQLEGRVGEREGFERREAAWEEAQVLGRVAQSMSEATRRGAF